MLKRMLPCLLIAAAIAPNSATAYTGFKSTEAWLSFNAHIEIDDNRTLSKSEIMDAISLQTEYLMGPMGLTAQTAAPKGEAPEDIDRGIIINDIETKGNTTTVQYYYKQKYVIETGDDRKFKTFLPIAFDGKRFEVSRTRFFNAGKRGGVNVCTDEHYPSYEDLFYFWGPRELEGREDCPLREGKHYLKLDRDNGNLRIQRLDNTGSSRPEYERLSKRVKGEDVVHISMLIGMDDPAANSDDPTKSEDLNAYNFRELRRYVTGPEGKIISPEGKIFKKSKYAEGIEGFGFKSGKPWTRSQIEDVVPPYVRLRDHELPFVQEFEKRFSAEGVTVVIRMFFGPTGILENSKAFHYFLKDALENSSIMIYDGHSGLGGNINFDQIVRIRREEGDRNFDFEIPNDRYQIYFFNSCSSYSYYNDLLREVQESNGTKSVIEKRVKELKEKQKKLASKNKALMNSVVAKFFKKKKTVNDRNGTKNLDIITTGLETPFEGSAEATSFLFRAVTNWAKGRSKQGYQSLMEGLTMDNLVGVNGDEDNPPAEDYRKDKKPWAWNK